MTFPLHDLVLFSRFYGFRSSVSSRHNPFPSTARCYQFDKSMLSATLISLHWQLPLSVAPQATFGGYKEALAIACIEQDHGSNSCLGWARVQLLPRVSTLDLLPQRGCRIIDQQRETYISETCGPEHSLSTSRCSATWCGRNPGLQSCSVAILLRVSLSHWGGRGNTTNTLSSASMNVLQISHQYFAILYSSTGLFSFAVLMSMSQQKNDADAQWYSAGHLSNIKLTWQAI